MATLHLNSHNSASILFSKSHIFNNPLRSSRSPNHICLSKIKKIRAVQTETEANTAEAEDEDPAVNFAFVSVSC